MSNAAFSQRLDELLQRRKIGRLREQSLARLTGGASYETWALDVEGGEGLRGLILRRVPMGVPAATEQVGPETEAELFRAARAGGVPEPEIFHVLQPDDGLGRGFLAERMEGESLARRILRDERFAAVRPKLAFLCGQTLARIHGIETKGLPDLPVAFAAERLDELEAGYRQLGVARPVFELSIRWLRDHCPPAAGPPRLVHGDFRNGNLIVGEEGIRAVLDWELAHLGDPAEDLGWITVNSWRFGARHLPVGGFGTVEDLLAGYAHEGGRRITAEEIVYWRVMGSLSWGVKCHQMACPVSDGAPITVERAMIGRRVSENELDLLDMLQSEARF